MKRSNYIFRIALGAFVLCGYAAETFAQRQFGSHLQYGQYPELINPAYTLSAEPLRVYMTGQSQWTGVDGAPRTVLLGGHVKTKNRRSAIGLNLMHDKIGPERSTDANAFVGHSVRLSQHDYLAVAASVGVRFYNRRNELLGVYDPHLRNDIRETVGNVGVSLAYFRPEQVYIGVTLPRIGFKQFEEVQLFQEHFSVVGSYLFPIDEGFHIKASSWAIRLRDEKVLANFSAMAFLNRRIGLGVGYGTTKDVGVMASFALFDNKVRFGYGYQFGVASTTITGAGNGSHEIGLSYHFSKNGVVNLL